ncbi:MAG: hypothetical protein WC551_02040 [Patescibacteria group bacterium]
MRCDKCSKILKLRSEFCPSCGKKVPIEQRKKARRNFFFRLGFFLLLAVFFSVTLYFQINDKIDRTPAGIIYTCIFAAYGIYIIGYLVFAIVGLTKRRPAWGIATIVVVAIACAASTFAVLFMLRDQAFDAGVSVIQDNVSEAAAVKIMGDSIVAKDPIPGSSMPRVKATAQMIENRLQFLKVPQELEGYRLSVKEWAHALAVSTEDPAAWEALPDQPAPFVVTMRDAKAKAVLQDSLKAVAAVKEFGDLAIERRDRITMMYVAAKLLAQKHWLQSVRNYQEAGFLSLRHFVSPAFAADAQSLDGVGRRVCIGRGGIDAKADGGSPSNVFCIEDAVSSIQSIETSAADLAKGTSRSDAPWIGAWRQLEGEGVVTVSAPSLGTQYSASVQTFIDACHGKGGVVGGTGGIMTGLPTTESGWTCEFKTKGQNNGPDIPCWDFLTYSGGRYMGGNAGCEQEHLLPALDERTLKTRGAGNGISADYAHGSGTIQCSGDLLQPIPIPAGAAGVRNGILNSTAGPIPLNGNVAVYNLSVGRQIGEGVFANTTEVDTFTFSEDSFSATYAATVTVHKGDETHVVSCFGSVGGARIR